MDEQISRYHPSSNNLRFQPGRRGFQCFRRNTGTHKLYRDRQDSGTFLPLSDLPPEFEDEFVTIIENMDGEHRKDGEEDEELPPQVRSFPVYVVPSIVLILLALPYLV